MCTSPLGYANNTACQIPERPQYLGLGQYLALLHPSDVVSYYIAGVVPSWLFAAKLVLIAVLLLLSLFWKPARHLQRYFLVFLALFLAERAWQNFQPSWQALFPVFEIQQKNGFLFQMLGIQIGRLAIALAMIVALFIIGFRRKDFFLDLGDLDAPAEPMPVVGVDQPTNWRSLGLRLGLYVFLAAIIVLLSLSVLSGPRINWAVLSAILPGLPALLFLAALNSLNEEITYRASLLAPISKVLGAGQAMWLTAAFFGIGHFNGPGGVMGVLVTSLFGWILGRSMLETKGIFWPWFIHLCADLVLFSFLALSALQLSN